MTRHVSSRRVWGKDTDPSWPAMSIQTCIGLLRLHSPSCNEAPARCWERAGSVAIDPTHCRKPRATWTAESLHRDTSAMTFLGTPLWLWMAFGGIVTALLAFDLGVLHKRERALDARESLWLSAGYIGVALAFAAWVGWYRGPDDGMAFLTGYLIEKTLALDNVFLISMVFTYLAVPRQYQHKVLFWGILGVILSRALIIGLGTALVSQFAWLLYLFGIFLIFTGVRMLMRAQVHPDLGSNPVLGWMR